WLKYAMFFVTGKSSRREDLSIRCQLPSGRPPSGRAQLRHGEGLTGDGDRPDARVGARIRRDRVAHRSVRGATSAGGDGDEGVVACSSPGAAVVGKHADVAGGRRGRRPDAARGKRVAATAIERQVGARTAAGLAVETALP